MPARSPQTGCGIQEQRKVGDSTRKSSSYGGCSKTVGKYNIFHYVAFLEGYFLATNMTCTLGSTIGTVSLDKESLLDEHGHIRYELGGRVRE